MRHRANIVGGALRKLLLLLLLQRRLAMCGTCVHHVNGIPMDFLGNGNSFSVTSANGTGNGNNVMELGLQSNFSSAL